jgi:hypothetical protein
MRRRYDEYYCNNYFNIIDFRPVLLFIMASYADRYNLLVFHFTAHRTDYEPRLGHRQEHGLHHVMASR